MCDLQCVCADSFYLMCPLEWQSLSSLSIRGDCCGAFTSCVNQMAYGLSIFSRVIGTHWLWMVVLVCCGQKHWLCFLDLETLDILEEPGENWGSNTSVVLWGDTHIFTMLPAANGGMLSQYRRWMSSPRWSCGRSCNRSRPPLRRPSPLQRNERKAPCSPPAK